MGVRHAIQTNLSHRVKTEATVNRDDHSTALAHGHDLFPRQPENKFTPSALELHIDELVLTGFEPGDRFHIADAVERELARLLAEKGIPGLDGNSVAMDGLDAGKFKVTGGAHGIGTQAAQALHRQLSPIGGRSHSAAARSEEARK